MSDYEWRFCSICDVRIYKDEVEEDTIKTIDGVLYCIDCANDKREEEINLIIDKWNSIDNTSFIYPIEKKSEYFRALKDDKSI